ncbi:unnamed protein product [Nippostrongylus brasiliensis]|uniref:Catalase n=1 Tax=Nippostrongylus brasiliensis TaxID=27835 RepID=A0A0N4XH69_NIPBR|nr:unnamed protein product [Nippostrongylus brasiliensis]
MSTVLGLCLFLAGGGDRSGRGGLLGYLAVGPHTVTAQYSNVYDLIQPYVNSEFFARPHHDWINSGKFQGDIDGIDAELLREPDANMFYNALKNRQLTWKDGVIPYVMDPTFCE